MNNQNIEENKDLVFWNDFQNIKENQIIEEDFGDFQDINNNYYFDIGL